jgi:hypothetical protein
MLGSLASSVRLSPACAFISATKAIIDARNVPPCALHTGKHASLCSDGVTVLDGHPATLAWLGAVNGHRVRRLGVEHFGQTNTLADLYGHYGIDTNAIIALRKPSRRAHQYATLKQF